ncbi:olfactory receptor 10G4-like [Emydura macquarii macquarii]|uniref:olfactory receptor 10G4-like n=1 Tax=Emydura macquarii macquarii TaxID=1129001 RepID=UPI00352B0F23
MTRQNVTPVMEFTLLGFSEAREWKIYFFLLFLAIYLLTVMGNLVILVTINLSPQLHSPMYYFLRQLSLLDICYSSVTLPKMLADFLAGSHSISFVCCVAQLYSFHFFGGAECFLLTVMAYDRYVAICDPLHYSSTMNKGACVWLVAGTWLAGSLHSALQTALTFRLPFCGPNQLDHYFCDVPPLLKLACADTSVNEAVLFANVGVVALSSLALILGSYIWIISAVLRMHSEEGRRKAFSTCAAHLAVVVLLYGPCILVYMQPASGHPLRKVAAVFYTAVTPALNPVIYTLRNQEIKRAVRRLGWRQVFLSRRVQ